MKLYVNSYRTGNPERDAELADCLERNRKLPFLEVCAVEGSYTYSELFSLSQDVDKDEICIFANADIEITESFLRANKELIHGECWALSRHNFLPGTETREPSLVPMLFPLSQDVWCFRGPVKEIKANFMLGTPACDGSIAYILNKAGYRVTNPSKSIVAIHHHAVAHRTKKEELPGPVLEIPPCFLNRVAIVQLGRLGDILSVLPIAKDLKEKGFGVDWYVNPEFLPIFEYVSYVNPINCLGEVNDLPNTLKFVEKLGYTQVLCTQVYNNPEPLVKQGPKVIAKIAEAIPHGKAIAWADRKHKHDNFQLEQWARAGYEGRIHDFPLIFDSRDYGQESWTTVRCIPEGDKPIISYCLEATSSPYPDAGALEQWIKRTFTDYRLINIGRRLEKPQYILPLLEASRCLITVDTFALHAGYATQTPTIAIMPGGFVSAEPRKHWMAKLDYKLANKKSGREEIVRAVSELSPKSTNVVVSDMSECKLAILICSIKSRSAFLDRIMAILNPQIVDGVRVIVSLDDGEISIGAKRDAMLRASPGEYSVFMDDDDIPAKNYIKRVLTALNSNPDCVGLKVKRFKDGKYCGQSIHSTRFKFDSTRQLGNLIECERTVGHWCPTRTVLAQEIGYADMNVGEDLDYAKRLKESGLLKTEEFIDEHIYEYHLRTKRDGETVNLNKGTFPSDERFIVLPQYDAETVKNKKEYAKTNGYSFAANAVEDVHKEWEFIARLAQVFPNRKEGGWAWLSHAKSIVTAPWIPLSNLVDDQSDVVVSCPNAPLDSALIRINGKMKAFIGHMMELGESSNWEDPNKVFRVMISGRAPINIHIHPERRMISNETNWKSGDFLFRPLTNQDVLLRERLKYATPARAG